MRNILLFALLAGTLLLYSCGTANRAAYNSSNFINGIYYTPDSQETERLAKVESEAEQLKGETKKMFGTTQQYSFDSKAGVETILVGDTNVVNINYNPSITYTITDNDESILARLEKYDTPVYTVNIEWDNYSWNKWHRPYPYWSAGFGWYNPYWGPSYAWWGPDFGYQWYDPWYYGYGYYNPYSYRYGWYDPWYYYGYAGWYDPWWDPFYCHPTYYPGIPPVAPPHNPMPARDVYYGKRDGGAGSYNNIASASNNRGGSYIRRDASINQVRGNRPHSGIENAAQASASNKQGSVYRRGGNTTKGEAVYNNAAANKGHHASARPGNSTGQSNGSMYRRSAVQPNNEAKTSQRSSNTSASYYRGADNTAQGRATGSSSYNRGTSSATYNGSTRSNVRVSAGGGGSSSGGGSAYRR